MNSSGMKTAISDIVSEITVKPISRAPRNAVGGYESPEAVRAKAFVTGRVRAIEAE